MRPGRPTASRQHRRFGGGRPACRQNDRMRVYAHWLIRFGWIAVFVPPAVVFAVMAATQPLVPNSWLGFVQAAGFIALGVRAAIGGVQVTEHEFVVRNLFTTKRIPRKSVTGFGSLGNFWANRMDERRRQPRRDSVDVAARVRETVRASLAQRAVDRETSRRTVRDISDWLRVSQTGPSRASLR